MNMIYGESWFRAKKRLTEEWEKSRAEENHASRQPYVAVLGEEGEPRCFVEVNDDYIGVGFLDTLQREYLSYQFQEVERGRMFLSMATHREFDGSSESIQSSTTYYFERDGRVLIRSHDLETGQVIERETHSDLSGNWELYPTFGQYESITRAQR